MWNDKKNPSFEDISQYLLQYINTVYLQAFDTVF